MAMAWMLHSCYANQGAWFAETRGPGQWKGAHGWKAADHGLAKCSRLDWDDHIVFVVDIRYILFSIIKDYIYKWLCEILWYFARSYLIVALIIGTTCETMDNQASHNVSVWLAADTGNHLQFVWWFPIQTSSSGICMDFQLYGFDSWVYGTNNRSLHAFRLPPWKFVSTPRRAIWQQTCWGRKSVWTFHQIPPLKINEQWGSATMYID